MATLAEGHRLGPYRIVRLLGEGGMGAVYEARQDPLDRRVALKTLHPEYARMEEAVARFFNEAKVLSRLEHPSIVQASDFGHASDGTAYLVMEYLRGESLAHRLRVLDKSSERLTVVVSLQLAWQVADVLAIAHAQGIVHRDLKPENLMLVADPVAPGGERVKILDFGIAKLTKASDRGSVKTDTQAVMGTPMYMSPEQCAGAGGVDAKTDVYSLGCVLYQVLAGRPPFVAEGSGQLIGMHLFQQPPALINHAPKVSKSIAELVHRLLIKDKNQRPSMSETADALGILLGKLSGSGPVVRSRPAMSTNPDARPSAHFTPPSTTLGQLAGQRSRSAIKRNRILAGGVTIVLAATAGIAAALYSFGSHTVMHAPSSGSTASMAAAAARLPPGNTNQSALAPTSTQSAPIGVSLPQVISVPKSLFVPPPLTDHAAVHTLAPMLPTRPPSAHTAPARIRTAPARKPAVPATPSPPTVSSSPANPTKLNPYDL